MSPGRKDDSPTPGAGSGDGDDPTVDHPTVDHPATGEDRTASEDTLSRKRFVDVMLGATFGGFTVAVAYPVSRYLIPPERAEVSASSVTLSLTVDDIPPNSGVIFRFGSRPGILIRTPSGELRAFSARCTHLDCTVQYQDDLEHIWCACHNGHFDLSGRNIAGPPPEPLEAFDVNVRGTQIIVSRRS